MIANSEFEQAYAFAERMKQEWKLKLSTFTLEQAPEEICYGGPKVEMTKRALRPYDVWISGVRRTEGIT